MWLIRHKNCFSDRNGNEFIMTDNNANKDSFPEVRRSGKSHNHSSFLHSCFLMGGKQSCSLAKAAKVEEKRRMDPKTIAYQVVLSYGACAPPICLCSVVCSELGSIQREHRRELLPPGWQNTLFGKVIFRSLF